MKRLFFTLTLLAALGTVAKADIQFNHGPWKEILAQAGKENKLIFVDAYTSWCGPCKWMAANTFTNPEVADFFNANFVNAKIDMEKGEGPELQIKYNVRAYPTLLFVAASGELVQVAVGALDPEQFLALGKSVIDPSFMSLQSLKAKFEDGETDREFLANYILKLMEVNEDFKAALERFRPGMAGDALLDEVNWKVFHAGFTKTTTEEGKYFLSHLPAFEAKYGKELVTEKALMMYSSPMSIASYNGDAEAYAKAKENMQKSGVEGASYRVLQQDLDWYKKQEDWDNYKKTVYAFLDATPEPFPTTLNSFAWTFYEHIDNTKDMKAALKWATKACEADPQYAILDTKAMVLMKLGRTDEAIVVAKEAIEAAKASGEAYEETEKALNEMLGK